MSGKLRLSTNKYEAVRVFLPISNSRVGHKCKTPLLDVNLNQHDTSKHWFIHMSTVRQFNTVTVAYGKAPYETLPLFVVEIVINFSRF